MVESGSPPSAIAQTSAKSGGVDGGRDSRLHLPAYLLAARLQTLDGGAPVSGYDVRRAMDEASVSGFRVRPPDLSEVLRTLP